MYLLKSIGLKGVKTHLGKNYHSLVLHPTKKHIMSFIILRKYKFSSSYTEEYMHKSIKKNEYGFLEDLQSFLFLMEVSILSCASSDFRMQLEQYTDNTELFLFHK